MHNKYTFKTCTFETDAPEEFKAWNRDYFVPAIKKFKEIASKCAATATPEKCKKCYYMTLSREDHKGCLDLYNND